MVIKSIRKLTRIRDNGIIQFQFFHRCIIHTTGCKLIKGLPRFSRITLRLNKCIRIIRCFRNFDVIVYYISQLFVPFSVSEDGKWKPGQTGENRGRGVREVEEEKVEHERKLGVREKWAI